MSLKQLVEVSNKYGRDPEVVLAGGGNTSWKDERFLYIKASGTTLATITEEGFVRMDRAKLAAMWEKRYPEDNDRREAEVLADLMAARANDPKRPSVETMLHDLFPHSYVVHTHPALVNGLTCSVEGKAAAERLFGSEVVWVPATMPGYVLARDVREQMNAYKERTGKPANLLLLENHGIFVAGDTVEEIGRLMDLVMDKLKAAIKQQPDFSPVAAPDSTEEIADQFRQSIGVDADCVIYLNNFAVNEMVRDAQSFAAVGYAFTPDHMVYYKHTPLFVKKDERVGNAIAAFEQKYGFMPKAAAVQGIGVFCLGRNEKEAETVRMLFLDAVKIAIYAQSFGGGQFMPDWLVDFIANWEVESYRKKQAE